MSSRVVVEIQRRRGEEVESAREGQTEVMLNLRACGGRRIRSLARGSKNEIGAESCCEDEVSSRVEGCRGGDEDRMQNLLLHYYRRRSSEAWKEAGWVRFNRVASS